MPRAAAVAIPMQTLREASERTGLAESGALRAPIHCWAAAKPASGTVWSTCPI